MSALAYQLPKAAVLLSAINGRSRCWHQTAQFDPLQSLSLTNCATVTPLIQLGCWSVAFSHTAASLRGRAPSAGHDGAHNCTSFMRSLRISTITSGISRGRAVMTVATPRRGSAVVKA